MYSIDIIDNDTNIQIISGDFYYGTPDINVYNKDELYCAVGTLQNSVEIKLSIDDSVVYTITDNDILYINSISIFGLNSNQKKDVINDVLLSKPETINKTIIELLTTPTNPTVYNLPDATTNNGFLYVIKKTDNNDNLLTINPVLGQYIDGNTTYSIKYKSSLSLISNGINWSII